MRGIVLFTVETDDRPFAPNIVRRLMEAQMSRKAIYHLNWVRVIVGKVEGEPCIEGQEVIWRVTADTMGELTDTSSINTYAWQLVTRLYAEVCDQQDTACDLLFLSADSACGTASMRLADIVHRRIMSLYPVKVHMILLQDQLTTFGDAATWHMLQVIQEINQADIRYYSSLYVLPWEKSKQESTCATIEALVLVMVVGSTNPMLVDQTGSNPMWIETAAVTHLEAPVNEISRLVFRFLVERFFREVLEPSIQYDGSVLEGIAGIEAGVRELKDSVDDIVRAQQLMPLSELYEIMPAQDPTTILSEKEDMPRAEKAWREIYRIYGDDIADGLKEKLNPGTEQLDLQYARLREAVTEGLLKQSIGLANERGLSLDLIPSVMSAMGQQFLAEDHRMLAARMDEQDYKRGLLLGKKTKTAVDIARTRQLYLRSVYNEVRKTYNQKHKEALQKAVNHAIADAKHYYDSFMISLSTRFKQSCDIQLEQMPSGNYYAVRLKEVYNEWCTRQGLDLETVTTPELYDLFTDEVLAQPPESAAESICDALIDRFNECTRSAVARIRVHIGQFFKEISFRSSMLPNIGVNENLINQLIHFMDQQTTAIPMLFESVGDMAMRNPKAKAFIFHEVDGDSSREFGQSAREQGINVLNDPFETGVRMIVKYADNALDHMLLYLNNQPIMNDR